MRKTSRFNAALALGSLTAAVALLAGAPQAGAQTAPGGGSFPGSFLVPGTNTSFKVGGAANIRLIEDIDAPNTLGLGVSQTTIIQDIPLEGSLAHSNNHSLIIHPRNSFFFFDSRTPTAYGDLTVFLLVDSFGQNTSEPQNTANSNNIRLSYAYGTLGGLLVGNTQSLMYDTDAVPEQVDPTVASVGYMGPFTIRDTQIRYTYAMPGGLSAALAIANPEFEGIDALTGQYQTSTDGTGNGLLGVDKRPDVIFRLRDDGGWGHLGLQGVLKAYNEHGPAQAGIAPTGDHFNKTGYGIELTGHVNTLGKDTLKFALEWGRGLGRYMSDYPGQGSTFNPTTGALSLNLEEGGNIAYTHWWTGAFRTTADVAYSHQHVNDGILTSVATGGNPLFLNVADRNHYLAFANAVWSPVPQVDLGIEYEFLRRVVSGPGVVGVGTNATISGPGTKGNSQRIEAEAVFKF